MMTVLILLCISLLLTVAGFSFMYLAVWQAQRQVKTLTERLTPLAGERKVVTLSHRHDEGAKVTVGRVARDRGEEARRLRLEELTPLDHEHPRARRKE